MSLRSQPAGQPTAVPKQPKPVREAKEVGDGVDRANPATGSATRTTAGAGAAEKRELLAATRSLVPAALNAREVPAVALARATHESPRRLAAPLAQATVRPAVPAGGRSATLDSIEAAAEARRRVREAISRVEANVGLTDRAAPPATYRDAVTDLDAAIDEARRVRERGARVATGAGPSNVSVAPPEPVSKPAATIKVPAASGDSRGPGNGIDGARVASSGPKLPLSPLPRDFWSSGEEKEEGEEAAPSRESGLVGSSGRGAGFGLASVRTVPRLQQPDLASLHTQRDEPVSPEPRRGSSPTPSPPPKKPVLAESSRPSLLVPRSVAKLHVATPPRPTRPVRPTPTPTPAAPSQPQPVAMGTGLRPPPLLNKP